MLVKGASEDWAKSPDIKRNFEETGIEWVHHCTDTVMTKLRFHIQDWYLKVSTLRLMQNGRHFPDNIFTHISLNEHVGMSIQISLKIVCEGPINNNPAWVQIIAWCQLRYRPISESMMILHLCVTQPQWIAVTLQILTIYAKRNLIITVSAKTKKWCHLFLVIWSLHSIFSSSDSKYLMPRN